MMQLDNITLYLGDCLEVMKNIPAGSVDMVLCDLPYGTTKCKWDNIIPFAPLWECYHRVCKENAAIVLFGAEPFSSSLRLSNVNEFRYDWVWQKSKQVNFLSLKIQPARMHEMISVFYQKQPTYNPQMRLGTPYKDKGTRVLHNGFDKPYNEMRSAINRPVLNTGVRYPSSVIDVSNVAAVSYHPTMKPTSLLGYLIRTYTNEGETVLDNTMGSGSTMVACVKEKRKGIGIEKMQEYYDIAVKRVQEELSQPTLF